MTRHQVHTETDRLDFMRRQDPELFRGATVTDPGTLANVRATIRPDWAIEAAIELGW